MTNDVVPEAVVERGIEIHDDDETDDQGQETNHSVTGRKFDCPKRFRDTLRNKLFPRGADPTEIKQKRDENAAYKRLLVNLENVSNDHSWDAVKVAVHAALLAVFVVALVAAMSIREVNAERVLHLRIPRWVALLMLAVSGLPCIQFVTFVVSEPLVWYRIRTTRMYTVYVARKMKKSVDVTLWFLLVLGVWYTWFRPQIVKDTRGAKTLGIPISQYKEALHMAVKQVTRLLMALTLGAFLWTVKDAMYVRLNGNIHYKDLCPMIRQTLLDYHAIQFIAPDEEIQSRSLLEDAKGFWMDVSSLKKGSAPIWILKNLCLLYREHMLKKKPKILSDLDSTDDEDKFRDSAEDLYEKFFISKSNQKSYLITDDDIAYHGLDKKKLDFVFKMFYSEEQQITKDDFVKWAVKALKGCLRLERILESSRRIFKKLNMLMISCVIVLVIIIWLLISEIVTTTQLAILFAPLVSASFVFGESLKRTFDGLIFVFAMHPFDVDQRVIVDNIQMRVTQLRLLTTVFFVYETGDEVVYPNSVLATKSITKQDHTKNMPDFVEFTIPVDTPEELISDLGVKIKKSLDDEVTFTPNTVVAKKEISETNITLIVHFKYLVAYKSAEIKACHRSKILEKIVRFREEMKRVHDMEKVIENEKDEYEADASVKLRIDARKVKMLEIEELKKNIIEILQGCESSKDCSKVITMMEKGSIYIVVHIRHRKDRLKSGVKDDLKKKIRGLKDDDKIFLEDENGFQC